ncbi:MAG: putative scaffolding protein [Prokaryotic dsDNA virus sp.]|nr:MAG: putative scaffolding protein [Prokaryotic dsDNA virus sp.]
MGTEVEQDLEPITSEENEIEEVETEEVETDEIESGEEGDEEIEETQPQKTFTQQELNEIVQKRLAKLNKKKGDEPDDDTKSQLELERERNKLLTLAMQQATQGKQQPSDAAPDPDKFDGGEYDPEYKRQYEAYLLKKNEGHVQQLLSKERENDQRQRQQEAQTRELEAAQRAHYERALTLEVKDYDKHEDRVIEALGPEAFNVIIQGFDDSHALANYLGTPANQAKLDKLNDLVKQGTSVSTAKALAELGRISASLAVNSKSKPAPNPVDPLEGSTPGASADEAKINAAWKQYEKGAISMQQYIQRKRQITGSK